MWTGERRRLRWAVGRCYTRDLESVRWQRETSSSRAGARAGSNKPLHRLLWCAGAPNRLQWMFNNIRIRHCMDQRKLALLPSGSASNESLHAELNSWFRQTRQVHQSTLRLKLRVLGAAKLLAHDSAMHATTSRQMPASQVLARVAARPLFDAPAWRSRCLASGSGSALCKAAVPICDRRRLEGKQVCAWKLQVHKRPAAAQHDPVPRKRTAFSRKRIGSVRSGGVKTTIFARPASASLA